MKLEGVDAATGQSFQADIETPGTDFFEMLREFEFSEQELKKQIDKLNISADAKHYLLKFGAITVKVGEVVVNIGRKILDFVLKLFQEFPNAVFGVLFGLVVGLLISTVPIIGAVLASMVTPLAMTFGLGKGLIVDMEERALDKKLERKIKEFHATMGPLK